MQALLDDPTEELVRGQMRNWVLQFLPVEDLVPAAYAEWRPLVHDAMMFMLTHLSNERLAPKLIEQIDLPLETSTEGASATPDCQSTWPAKAGTSLGT